MRLRAVRFLALLLTALTLGLAFCHVMELPGKLRLAGPDWLTVQHNLYIASAYPDEQRFFFEHLEPARDAWGIAVCCGTSSMVRVSALRTPVRHDGITGPVLLGLGIVTAALMAWNAQPPGEKHPPPVIVFLEQHGRPTVSVMLIDAPPRKPQP